MWMYDCVRIFPPPPKKNPIQFPAKIMSKILAAHDFCLLCRVYSCGAHSTNLLNKSGQTVAQSKFWALPNCQIVSWTYWGSKSWKKSGISFTVKLLVIFLLDILKSFSQCGRKWLLQMRAWDGHLSCTSLTPNAWDLVGLLFIIIVSSADINVHKCTHLYPWLKRRNYSKVSCSRTQLSRPGFEPALRWPDLPYCMMDWLSLTWWRIVDARIHCGQLLQKKKQLNSSKQACGL